jgi:Cys-tRNA(Pro) deacylase
MQQQGEGTARVHAYIREKGVDARIIVFGESTHSSEQAARLLGCSVAQIAKSIVLVDDKHTCVVVLSGDRKVDLKKLKWTVGVNLRIATPDEVQQRTGYRVGGVPPFPHRVGVRVLIDHSVKRFTEVWAAAGDTNSLMRISTEQLINVAGGDLADVSK